MIVNVIRLASVANSTVVVINLGTKSYSMAIIEVKIAGGILACRMPAPRARPVNPKGMTKSAARIGPPSRRMPLAVITSKFI